MTSLLPRGHPSGSRHVRRAPRRSRKRASSARSTAGSLAARAQLNAITADANDRQLDILSKSNLFALATRKNQHEAASVGESRVWNQAASPGRAGRPLAIAWGRAWRGRLRRESPSGSRGGRGRPPRSLGSSARASGCAAHPSPAGVSRGSPRIRGDRSRASARTERSCCGADCHSARHCGLYQCRLNSVRRGVQKHGTGPWRLFGVRAGQAIACLPAGRRRWQSGLPRRGLRRQSIGLGGRAAPDSGHPTTGSSKRSRSNRKTGFG